MVKKMGSSSHDVCLLPDANLAQASGGLWSVSLKHPEEGNQLQSDALLHFCQVLMLLLVILVVIILLLETNQSMAKAYTLCILYAFTTFRYA